MEDTANKGILDRHKGQEDAEKFRPYLDLLKEIVDYGTNLILRTFFTSKRDLSAAIISGVFLKQGVALIDSIEILLSQGTVFGAILPVRALFEVTLCTEWLLAADTERRAKQYYVCYLREELEWAKRGIPGTEENKTFNKILDLLPPIKAKVVSEESVGKAKKQVEVINKILSQVGFDSINKEFERLRRKYDPPWYQPWGVNSLKDMAERLGRNAEYQILYSFFSGIAHGENLKIQVELKKEKITFEPIRHLKEIDDVLRNTIALALRLYQKILEYFRPEELPNFSRKYVEEWRERFRSIPKVTYKVEERFLG